MTPTSLKHRIYAYKKKRLEDLPPINKKIDAISGYLESFNIRDVVMGVSGGIDSAVVLGLLAQIPEITIHATNIHFELYREIFDWRYLHLLKRHFATNNNIVWHDFDLTQTFQMFSRETNTAKESPDVLGNISYAMRYLAFFSLAQKTKGVTCGTTNLDEMGYVGWFGKNSDMVVDIQPIADLHKFEVIRYAYDLGLPEEIIQRMPQGDLIDLSTDEENFGCSYDDLAYLTSLYQKGVSFNDEERCYFARAISLHEKNAHKYQGQNFNPVFLKQPI